MSTGRRILSCSLILFVFNSLIKGFIGAVDRGVGSLGPMKMMLLVIISTCPHSYLHIMGSHTIIPITSCMTKPNHTRHPLFISYTLRNLQNPPKAFCQSTHCPFHTHFYYHHSLSTPHHILPTTFSLSKPHHIPISSQMPSTSISSHYCMVASHSFRAHARLVPT